MDLLINSEFSKCYSWVQFGGEMYFENILQKVNLVNIISL